MRLILARLNQKELRFLLRLLNAAGSEVPEQLKPVPGETALKTSPRVLQRTEAVSADDAIWLDDAGEALRRRYEKGNVEDRMRKAGAWFGTPKKKRNVVAMRHEWTWPRLPLLNAVVTFRKNPASFVHWPSIVGLPAHHPSVLINDPCDLVGWMVTRGMANRQLQRFVKCARKECGKFGLRERAKKDARFCSVKCQVEANAEARKLRPTGTFGHVFIEPN